MKTTGAPAVVGERWFDFHVHTRASDGSRSALDVLRAARAAGLEGISITDHDTLDAYRELREAAPEDESNSSGPWILPGVELSTRLGDGEAHILGYFPDGVSSGIESYVEEILGRRRHRIAAGIVRLRERGIDISWDECARLATGRVVNRSHLAQVLADKRYVGRSHRAYADLLSPGVVPLPDVSAEDSVRDLARLGGVSVWAHPSLRSVEEHLPLLRAAGLEGVEVVIPRRNPRERRELAERVRAAGLLVAGGSDWHGKPSGRDLGAFRVGEAAVAELLRRIGR